MNIKKDIAVGTDRGDAARYSKRAAKHEQLSGCCTGAVSSRGGLAVMGETGCCSPRNLTLCPSFLQMQTSKLCLEQSW